MDVLTTSYYDFPPVLTFPNYTFRFSFPTLVNGSKLCLICVSDFPLFTDGSCLLMCSVAAVQSNSAIPTLTQIFSLIHIGTQQIKDLLFKLETHFCTSHCCWLLSSHLECLATNKFLLLFICFFIFVCVSFVCLYSWINFQWDKNASTTDFWLNNTINTLWKINLETS